MGQIIAKAKIIIKKGIILAQNCRTTITINFNLKGQKIFLILLRNKQSLKTETTLKNINEKL